MKNGEEKSKVLIITYDFYPDDSPNTYRWKNVLEEWSKKGVEVFVVSAQQPGFSKYDMLNGIRIYRTGSSYFEKIKARIRKSTIPENTVSEKRDSIEKKGLIKTIHDLTWKKLYFPDFAFLWRFPAQKLAEQILLRENIHNVITVSWPFTGHMVGHALKKKYDIFWIADTIDPFFLSGAVNNAYLYKSLNFRLEKRTLLTADALTVLTEKLRKKYASLFPPLANKIFVNHNLFIPYKIDVDIAPKNVGKIKLVFVGTLTPLTRSPDNLLNLFNKLLSNADLKESLELHFYGNTIQCNNVFLEYDFLLSRNLFIHGLVARELISDILSNADVLVNVGNSNEYQEPSKIIEYVYLGKPILNICSIKEDSSKEVLNRYPLNLNVYKEDMDDELKLSRIGEFIKTKKSLDRSLIDGIMKSYLLPEVERRYFELLKKKD